MGLPKGWSGLKTPVFHTTRSSKTHSSPWTEGVQSLLQPMHPCSPGQQDASAGPQKCQVWQGGFRLCRFAALPHARKQNTRALCGQIAFLLLRASSNLIWTQALSGSSPCCPALPVSFDSPDQSTQAANLAGKSGLFHSRINKPSSALPPVFPQ